MLAVREGALLSPNQRDRCLIRLQNKFSYFFSTVPGMSVLSEQAGVLRTCGKRGWLWVCAVALGVF